jgi:Ca2+-binding EF-hand superfamily protein
MISLDELKEMMSILGTRVFGERISDEDAAQMLLEADEDGDGFINYREFVKKIQNT